MSDTPPGEVYKGPSGIARDSQWLSNEDIPHDRDTVVEIECVTIRRNLQMQGGRPKSIALSLKFKGKQRELMLNATNRKTLAALFGTNECAQWFGRKIILYVQQDIRRPDGTVGPAVRIRAKLPKDAPAQTEATKDDGIDSEFERAAREAAGQ